MIAVAVLLVATFLVAGMWFKRSDRNWLKDRPLEPVRPFWPPTDSSDVGD